MNQHPITLVEPVFKWLDWLIAEHGLYLYMAAVWLSPLLIVWILRGGFWRRPPRRLRQVVTPPPVPQRPATTPPPLPESRSPTDDDSQSFPA
jgi:hypothetical protein